MKVKISETVEVSDEQRLAIARGLHGPNAKKDHASREELKDFVWRHGRDWDQLLARGAALTDEQPSLLDDDEDLIGGSSAGSAMDLI